eukprot:365847-Chlamydomonas_euryale.AAC.30
MGRCPASTADAARGLCARLQCRRRRHLSSRVAGAPTALAEAGKEHSGRRRAAQWAAAAAEWAGRAAAPAGCLSTEALRRAAPAVCAPERRIRARANRDGLHEHAHGENRPGQKL